MSKTVQIGSASQFTSVLESSKIVVTDFYADWCEPCKRIAPIFEQLSVQLSRPNKITFAKVNTDQHKDIALTYGIAALPTFIVFKNKEIVENMKGADPRKLQGVVKKLSAEADSDGTNGFGETSGSSSSWTAMNPPKGYSNVTDQVDVRGLDLLNADSECGTARTLFDGSMPSSLDTGKGKEKATSNEEEGKDWVESDTDEQLMLYIPFMSILKVHTLLITSLPPKEDDAPMRPKTIQIYSNRSHVLGFDEAEDLPATQTITIAPGDWDEKTATAKTELRFVKFQNVTSLVIFVVDGEGDGEKVRIDRLRIVGETGEKRDGKIEKIEHDH
ncbi:thioredoxin 1, partial [Lecanoromycetidae sp. Uapishka_2]